ncbi:MAG TPA: DNA primase [Candidatus Paceibacterota bacterium]
MNIRDALSVIKEKIAIEDVVAKYVALEKSGRNLRGRCPFHSERTPSFYVTPDRGRYHCFGCAKSGDVISFIQEIEGLSFVDAVKDFATQVGITVEFGGKDENFRGKDETEMYKKILEFSTKIYERNLNKTPQAIDYLTKKRGLTKESIEKFRIGYTANQINQLANELIAKKVDLNKAVEAGVINKNDRGSYYDTFRERIMFPIRDRRNEIIGFTGRIFPLHGSTTDADKVGKYVNTRETPLYQKQRVLYGIEFAQREIVKKGRVILVEGQLDVIMMHQHGYPEAVGVSGTAFTEAHAKLISQLSDNVIILFDSDAAGRKAIENAVKLLIPHSLNISIGRISSGKDPADYLLEGGKMEDILTKTISVGEFLGELFQNVQDMENVRTTLHKKIFPIIEVYVPLLREGFMRSLAQHTQVSKEILDQEFETFNKKRRQISSHSEPAPFMPPQQQKNALGAEEMVKLCLYGYPDYQANLPQVYQPYIEGLITQIPAEDEIYEQNFTKIQIIFGGEITHEYFIEMVQKAYRESLVKERKELLKQIAIKTDDRTLLERIATVSRLIDDLSK